MSVKKSISKSIRLTNEVYDYIENFEGDGFNQKLENLVKFCVKEETSKRKTLEYLDSEIKERWAIIRSCEDVMMASSKALTHIKGFNDRMETILKKMDK